MSSTDYLELTKFEPYVFSGVPHYVCYFTGRTFEDYSSYLEHLDKIKYGQFTSYFSGRYSTFLICIYQDLMALTTLLNAPLSHVLASVILLVLEEHLVRGQLFVFPGDVILCQKRQFIIVGKQDAGFIAKLCDTINTYHTFTAEKAIFAGKIGLFSFLSPVLDTHKSIFAVRGHLYNFYWLLTDSITQYARGEYSTQTYCYDMLLDSLKSLQRKLEWFKDQLSKFPMFANETICYKYFGFYKDRSIYYYIVDTAVWRKKFQKAPIPFHVWAQKNPQQARKLATYECRDLLLVTYHAVKESKLTPVEKQFYLYIEKCDFYELYKWFLTYNQWEIVHTASATEVSARNKNFIKELDANTELLNVDDVMLGIYQFFFWFHELLNLPLCSYEQFERAISYSSDERLYNGCVHAFQFYLICRLTMLLFKYDNSPVESFVAFRDMNGLVLIDKPKCASSDSDESSESYDDSTGSGHYRKPAIPSRSASVTLSNDSESEEKSYYTYSYYTYDSDTESDKIEQVPTRPGKYKQQNQKYKRQNSFLASDSSYEDYIYESFSDDYTITADRKPRQNTKAYFNAKKQELIKRKNDARTNLGQHMPQVARQIGSDEDDDISDTIVQYNLTKEVQNAEFSDLISFDAKLNTKDLGCSDDAFIYQLVYYIMEVSFPERDLFALQFICPLLNHLTHQFDEVFHTIYKKLERIELYSRGVQFNVYSYRTMHNVCDSEIRKLWHPDIYYPFLQFIEYGKLLGHDYALTEEQLYYFAPKLATKYLFKERHGIYKQIFRNHPTTKFVNLPIKLKQALLYFLVMYAQRSDNFIHVVDGLYEDKQEELEVARTKLRRLMRNYQSLNDEYERLHPYQSLNEYIAEQQDKYKHLVEWLEKTVQKQFFQFYRGSGIYVTGAQLMLSDHVYVKTGLRTVRVPVDQHELLQDLLDANQKYLINATEASGCVYSIPAVRPSRTLRSLNMHFANKKISVAESDEMLAYNLNNSLGLGYMHLGRAQFLDFMQKHE